LDQLKDELFRRIDALGKCSRPDTFVESSYARATRFRHENYSYIFEGPEGSTKRLLFNPWSKQVGRSEVLKHGTLQDIAKLAPPSQPK
jgi:hypothetical protein